MGLLCRGSDAGAVFWCGNSTGIASWSCGKRSLGGQLWCSDGGSWTGASQRWGHLDLVPCLLFWVPSQLQVGATPFSSSHRNRVLGLQPWASSQLLVYKCLPLGSVRGKIPQLLVLPRASQGLRKQL